MSRITAPQFRTPNEVGEYLAAAHIHYQYGARLPSNGVIPPGRGVDCSGFIAEVMRKMFGKEMNPLESVTSLEQPHLIAKILDAPASHYASLKDMTSAWAHTGCPKQSVIAFSVVNKGRHPDRNHHVLMVTTDQNGEPVFWHSSASGQGINRQRIDHLEAYLSKHKAHDLRVVDITRPLYAARPDTKPVMLAKADKLNLRGAEVAFSRGELSARGGPNSRDLKGRRNLTAAHHPAAKHTPPAGPLPPALDLPALAPLTAQQRPSLLPSFP